MANPWGVEAEEVAQVELLLLRAQWNEAADVSLVLLQRLGSLDSPLANRLLAVVFQSHWFLGRQQALLQNLRATHGGLPGLPLQAFILWQVLQLESGAVDTCKEQVEARLQDCSRLARIKPYQVAPGQQHHPPAPPDEPGGEPASTNNHLAAPTGHDLQTSVPDTHGTTCDPHGACDSPGCQAHKQYAADLAALCRLYVVDILCQELQAPDQAAVFLGSPDTMQLLQDADLQGLRTQLAAATLSAATPHPQSPQSSTPAHPAATEPARPAPPLVPDDSSLFCTMMGELNEEEDERGQRLGATTGSGPRGQASRVALDGAGIGPGPQAVDPDDARGGQASRGSKAGPAIASASKVGGNEISPAALQGLASLAATGQPCAPDTSKVASKAAPQSQMAGGGGVGGATGPRAGEGVKGANGKRPGLREASSNQGGAGSASVTKQAAASTTSSGVAGSGKQLAGNSQAAAASISKQLAGNSQAVAAASVSGRQQVGSSHDASAAGSGGGSGLYSSARGKAVVAWQGLLQYVQQAVSVLKWQQASELIQAVVVAVLLYALHRERRGIQDSLVRLLRGLQRNAQGLLGMAFSLSPNPMMSGHMPRSA